MDLSSFKRLSINGVSLKELRANGKLIWSALTKWEKFNCNVETVTDEVYERVTPSGETKAFTAGFITAYYGYDFRDWGGFSGFSYDNEYVDTVEKANSVNLIGMYLIYPEDVWEIISVDEVKELGGELSLKFTAKLVDQCELVSSNSYEVYSKGSISYGTVEAEEGALPESGTLIGGSVADGYCVLEIDGTYFYYVLQND